MERNEQIRNLIKQYRIFHWEIAAQIGVAATTLCRWLRTPLNDEQYNCIMSAIKQLREGENNG